MIVLNADDYRGESQNAYCISDEGIEIKIFYSTKNKCIFSREKLKPVNDISSLDLDLSLDLLVLIRWISDDIFSLLSKYMIVNYLRTYKVQNL